MSFKHSIAFDGDGPIQIVRDANGVPVVKAQYDTDLYRGLGYCHGADRGLRSTISSAFGAASRIRPRCCGRWAWPHEWWGVAGLAGRGDQADRGGL